MSRSEGPNAAAVQSRNELPLTAGEPPGEALGAAAGGEMKNAPPLPNYVIHYTDGRKVQLAAPLTIGRVKREHHLF
jgi:hypothetical protein